MAEKALTAILSAQESISEALKSVSDQLEEVAEAAGVASEVFDETEESTERVNDAMKEAKAATAAAEDGFEGLSVEARKASMTADDLESSMESLNNSQAQLAGSANAAEDELAGEAQSFREAMISADNLAEAKQAASRANSMLTGTAKQTKDAIEGELGAMYRMAQAADTAEELLNDMRNSEMALARVAESAAESVDDMSAAALANAVAARIDETALNDLTDTLEETGDEASQTALQMAGLGGAFAATSINLGPFNVALREAAVQIPQLVIAVGTLTTALGGLASAAVVAGAAIASIYAGGVLAMAQQMAATNSEYKNTWEAIQGVMEDVRATFMRALEPLMNQDNIEMFKDGVEGLASFINLLAQLFNSLRGEVDAFLSEVSTSFFENAQSILGELADTVEVFLPILADFFVWFNDNLPGALQFFQDEGQKAISILTDFGQSFLNFFTSFSELGVAAFAGILTALGGLLEALRIVADILNMLPDSVIASATAFLILSRAMSGALGMGVSLGKFFTALSTSILQSRSALGLLNSVLAAFQLTGAQEALGLLAKRFGMLDEVAAASSEAAVDSMEKILDMEDLGEGVEKFPNTIRDRLGQADQAIRDFAGRMRTRAGDIMSGLSDGITSRAGKLRTALVSAAGSAATGMRNRLHSANIIDDAFESATRTDVALGGPRISRDSPEVNMDSLTRTGRAKQKLASFRDAVINTGGKIRNFASGAMGALRKGFESVAARSFGVISAFTGMGEVIVGSLTKSFGDLGRGVENVRSGLATMAPELVPVKDRMLELAKAGGSTLLDGMTRGLEGIENGIAGLDSAFERAGSRIESFNQLMRDPSFTPFVDAASSARSRLSGLADDAMALGSDAMSSLSEAFTGGAQSAGNFTSALTNSTDTMTDTVGTAANTVSESTGGIVDSFRNISFSGFLGRLSNLKKRIANASIGRALKVAFTDSGIRDLATGQFTTISDAFSDRLSTMRKAAANASIGSALDVSFEDSGIRDLQTGQFTDLGTAFRDRLSSMSQAAKNASIGSALDLSFEDSGLRDLRTGQFTSFSQAIKDRVVGAAKTAIGPLQRMGGAVRNAAGNFASSIASISSYSEAMDLVNKKTTQAITKFKAMAVAAGRNVIGAVRGAASTLYGYAQAAFTAQTTTLGLDLSMKKLALSPIKAAKGLIGLATTLYGYVTAGITATLTSTGLVHSLALIQAQGIPVISTIAGMAASFVGMAATEGLATAATMALSTALNVGLAGIPALIGGIVVVAGALAGILSNMGGITSAAKGAFEGLKQAGQALFNALIKMGVPIWNLFITLLEVVLAPVFALWDAFMKLAQGLGLVSDGGGGVMGVFGAIGDILGFLVDIVASFVGIFIGPFNFIADIIYAAVFVPLSLLIDYWLWVIDLVAKAIDWFMNLGPVQNVIDGINRAVQDLIGAWDTFMEVVDAVVKFAKNAVEEMVNYIIGLINGFIDMINNVPFVDIGKLGEFSFGGEGAAGGASERLAGAEASAAQAKENADEIQEDDESSPDDDMAGGQQTVVNTYEQNNYNFGDFNMKPEEKARVKGLVQEAIEEANRTKRLRDGGI